MSRCTRHSFVAWIGIVVGLVFISACGGFPKHHSDPQKNTPISYKVDMKDCADNYPETPDGVYIKQRIGCMNLKGWQ